ncbi:MAG: PEP-CTERM sorting domain-containing protein [Phycisphaerales bacterium]
MQVTGSGSSVTVGNSIQVGGGNSAQSENNRLEVLDGGHVTGGSLLMGVTEFGDNNTTLVSGAGSTLSILSTGRSDIGRFGAGHTLQIENGGTVDGSAHYALGVESGSVGNVINVSGSGASLTGSGVEAIRGTMNVNGGAVILNDYFNVGDGIYEGGNLIANAGAVSVINLNSGSISTVNANIGNGSPFVVGDGGGSPAAYTMLKTGDNLNGTHTFADGLSLNSNATLSGSGDIVGSVSGLTGASVDVGASPGLINVDGDWDNSGLNISLEVDNPISASQAGEEFDLLSITGAFTHGGSVVIDVSGFTLPGGTIPLKLIGWGSEIGSSASTSVSVVGGSIPVQFQSDGLYVLVPEPATLGLFGFATLGAFARRRKQ